MASPSVSLPAAIRLLGRAASRRASSPRLQGVARTAGLIAGIGYLLIAFAAGVGEIGYLPWLPYLQAAVIGLALYSVSLFAQAIGWTIGFGCLGRRSLRFQWSDIAVYASSHLMRRLPGGIWYLADRVAAYREQGVRPAVPLAASGAELLLLVVSAAAAYLGMRFGSSDVVAALAAVGLTGACGWTLGGILARAGWLPGGDDAPGRTRQGRLGLVYLVIGELYLASMAVAGVILFLFLDVSSPGTFGLRQVIGIWGLVAAVGTVIGLLPIGVAIREVTLVVVLGPYLPPPAPVVIAAFFRLLFMAGDLVWGSALLALARRLEAVRQSPSRPPGSTAGSAGS